MTDIDVFNEIAKQRGVPDGWRWFKIDFVGEGEHSAFLVCGGVCNVRFKKGKRVGELNWSKRDQRNDRELVVTRADVTEFKAKWSAETGKCAVCWGEGKTVASVSTFGGETKKTYRDCKDCGASGKAQTP